MFPQFKKLNNESGIILFIVLMTAIVIMLFSLGILTQSMNEINYAQQQIDQLASEQWSKGMFWNAYSTNAMQTGTSSTIVDGRNYQISTTSTVNPGGGNIWQVTTNYDTYQ